MVEGNFLVEFAKFIVVNANFNKKDVSSYLLDAIYKEKVAKFYLLDVKFHLLNGILHLKDDVLHLKVSILHLLSGILHLKDEVLHLKVGSL